MRIAIVGGGASGMVTAYLLDKQGRGLMLVSGIIGIIFGIFIWSNFPFNAVWLIGTFIGINLLFDGVWMLTLHSGQRRALQ